MRGKRYNRHLILVVILLSFFIGCANSPPQKTKMPPVKASALTRKQPLPLASYEQIETKKKKQDLAFSAYYPVSAAQFKYICAELESYRMFSHQLKMQNDIKAISVMQPYVFEYLEKNIDQLIQREMPNRNYDNAEFLASILYYEAFLYWVFDEPTKARIIIRGLHESFPKEIKEGSLQHYEIGTIPFKRALKKLESDIDKIILTNKNI